MNASDAPYLLRLRQLPTTGPTTFDLEPDADARADLSAELDLLDLRKLRMKGRIMPDGARNWRLEAELGATAVQPCAVTLAPVTTRVDVPVLRRYLADYVAPDEAETEVPEDDSIEPLPEAVDLFLVLAESLALALPDYPRADGVELGEAVYSEPGTEPLRDADVKPFAGLAELKKKLEG
ncbi:YceD family protein [Tropicimonas marinistellae]|uniref:YceD family protein n=1 Tax=Tropicimonas marinistellae TaxID=1739787 RepID=UPI000834CEAD|nr:DUF177 domain-containing protein [Tropicimonas marinistellae]